VLAGRQIQAWYDRSDVDAAIIGCLSLIASQQKKSMDKIFLNELKIDTIIGIYDWERHTKQTLSFDLEMDWDIAKAAASDDIADTLDYGEVANAVVQFVENNHYQLIERLAEDVAALLLEQFPIPKLKLTLSKPVALHGQNIARIVIKRSR
jgi:dihydroneopterin aldolase